MFESAKHWITALLVVFHLAGYVGYAPQAHAGMVGTESAVSGNGDREQLEALLARQAVRDRLVAMGVDPVMVDERVAALSRDEARQLASRIDAMPAGGDVLGTAVFIFLVLLATDILGYTDIFPFVKKTVN